MAPTITLENIRRAEIRLHSIAARTRLIEFKLCETDPRRLFLKPENQQPIGAFKLRGAYNKIALLSDKERKRGVISYSSGNHAQGVAYAARALGVKAVIVMPENAPAVKRQATAALGAEIVVVGPSGSERQIKAEELAARHGYVIVPPYNDEQIIAGQGTMGLEILEDLPEVRNSSCAHRWGRHDQRRGYGDQVEQAFRKSDRRGTRVSRRCAGQLASGQDC